MSSVGLNKWIVSGNLGADAEIKTIDLKNGEKAKVASATIYVRKPRSKDESFTVRLSIWEGSAAWRKLPYLKKGSLIICTGSVDTSPYISGTDNAPRAGLEMSVLDIDLDNIRNGDEEPTAEAESTPASASEMATAATSTQPAAANGATKATKPPAAAASATKAANPSTPPKAGSAPKEAQPSVPF
jgi:single-strand DNA-binding protein